jgi:hypothetical protein
MLDYSLIFLAVLGPLTIKLILFLIAFRIRSITISFTGCVIIAGLPMLIQFVSSSLSLPIPTFFVFIITLCGTMWLITHYTEAELFPDVVVITFSVEILFSFVIQYLVVPLFPENSRLRMLLP